MSRRRPWIYAAVGLAVVGLLVALGARWLGWPERTGPRTVTDRAEMISLAIPAGWTDQTRRDARQIVPGDSGDGAARVPDIVVWKEGEEDTVPVVLHVFLDVAPEGAGLPSLHQINSGSLDSKKSGTEVDSPIRRWPSMVSSGSNGAAKVVTVLTDTFLVTIYAYAYADDSTMMREADPVIASLKVKEGF